MQWELWYSEAGSITVNNFFTGYTVVTPKSPEFTWANYNTILQPLPYCPHPLPLPSLAYIVVSLLIDAAPKNITNSDTSHCLPKILKENLNNYNLMQQFYILL